MSRNKAAPILFLFAGLPCLAQSPAFDAASLRLADAAKEIPGPRIRTSPDSLTIQGSSLRDCIQLAYEMPATQVTGPDWLGDVRLDIVAKAAGPVDEKQLHLMLRTLLGERLGVKAHVERKEIPVYALTIAKGGPKFSESTTEGPPIFGKGKDGPNMQRVSMSDLAMALSQPFGRPVVDATGLKGRYDIHMNMTSYVADGNPATPMDAATIMITALQEQMGLKVEARKDAVDVLMVDHAEKTPTEN
jgi:uncharacterized protein (TIGR03435 family)